MYSPRLVLRAGALLVVAALGLAGSSVSTAAPAVPTVGGPLPTGGVYITSLVNLIADADGTPSAFPFNHEPDDTPYWDITDPTVITVPATGWYWVGVDITTLGTGYGGANNQKVMIQVVRNWDGLQPHLDDMVAWERFYNLNGISAHGNSLLQPVYLNEGDELQLILQSGGNTSLLVESNPSDGIPSGFLADEGPGTLSPHFYIFPV